MVRPNLAGPSALFLGLLITLAGTPTPCQEPAQPPESNEIPTGAPQPPGVQTELEPSATPPEPLPPALPAIDGGPAVQSPPPDAFAPSAGGFSPFMSPVVGHAPIRTDYRAIWFSSEPVSGQPTNLGSVQQDFSLSFPLWQCAGTDEWLGSVNLRSEIFHTHAILPDTRQPFPDDLWNVRFGTTYRHLFDNGWIAGGTLTVGSASDKPFHSIDELTAGISAFLRIPQGEHNAWLLSLSYSPVSELPYPIPGVAFLWQPSENFRANLGVPFQVMWRPVDDLTLDLSYMLLTTFHARATYRLCRPVRLYVAYATENEAYLLADRLDVNDRFFNVDQRVTGGVQVNISPRAALDISSGYLFDHHFFEGKNITNGTNFNRVDVGDGTYVSAQFRIRW
jgi:hypothetical protein